MMMKSLSIFTVVVALATFAAPVMSLSSSAVAAGDAEKGKKVFRHCSTCHMVGPNARKKIGPVLNKVFGRTAGTAEDYKYSTINKNAGEAGLVWTPELVAAYLPDPNKFLVDFLKDAGQADKAKGRTKMSFRLSKEGEIQDVIAYLQTFSEKK